VGVRADVIGEAHLEADRLADRRVQFLGDARGQTARGDAPRLGMADQAVDAAAEFQADLRQLGGLARTGLAADDDDLMCRDRGLDVLAARDHRQVKRIIGPRQTLGAPRATPPRGLDVRGQRRQSAIDGLPLLHAAPQPGQPCAQRHPVGGHDVIEGAVQFVQGRQRRHPRILPSPCGANAGPKAPFNTKARKAREGTSKTFATEHTESTDGVNVAGRGHGVRGELPDARRTRGPILRPVRAFRVFRGDGVSRHRPAAAWASRQRCRVG